MADFKYNASDKEGRILNNVVKASSVDEANNILLSQGLTPIKIQPLALTSKEKHNNKKIKLLDKQVFFDNLSQMLKAGLPLTESLESLKDNTNNKNFQAVISDIKYNIETGNSLSFSLKRYPKIFDNLTVKMIEVGEIGGTLMESSEQLAEQLKKDYELRGKVKGAMIYPLVILVLMVTITIGLLIFVIPSLTSLFTSSGMTIPITTQILITMSTLLKNDFIFIAIGCVILSFILKRLMALPLIKHYKDLFIIHLPVIGETTKKINTTIFCRTLASLIRSGVPITDGLQITGDALSNSLYHNAVVNFKSEVEKGTNLSDVMRKYPKYFSSLTLRMVSVGDKTGTTPDMLMNTASFYQKQIDDTLSNISTIIEPVMIVVMGAGVLFLALSVIMPIYQLTSGISNSATPSSQ